MTRKPDRTPIAMLSDSQLARLFVALEVPVAVQDILTGETELDDATQLALHDLLAGQTPDRALLSIAVSTLLVEAHLQRTGERAGEVLAISAEMIVQDYAPAFLDQTRKRPGTTIYDRHDVDFLATIPEDLESLADLLGVLADVLPDSEALYRRLALILSQQAGAQALVAETLAEIAQAGDEEFIDDTLEADTLPARAAIIAPTASNVIPFRRK